MDPDPPSSSSPRKVKFAPKGPPRRELKPPRPKSEAAEEGDGGNVEINASLLRKVNDHLTRRHSKAEKKSSAQVVFSHGVASSTSIRTFGVRKEGTGDITNAEGLEGSTPDDGQDSFSLPSAETADGILENSENGMDLLFKKKKKGEYKEPWDYSHSYYPTTLPLRKPNSGDPELLDEDEFGRAASAVEYDDSTVNSASSLGLLDKVDAAKIFFFQLPASIPLGNLPTSRDKMEAAGSIKLPANDSPARSKNIPGGIVASPTLKGKEVPGHSSTVSARREGKQIAEKKVGSLEELPAGCMGKMLVYKSGTVKLKIGDILYDVSPGCDFTFAQEIVTVNANEKQCCALGELRKRAIVTPDIDSLLDPM